MVSAIRIFIFLLAAATVTVSRKKFWKNEIKKRKRKSTYPFVAAFFGANKGGNVMFLSNMDGLPDKRRLRSFRLQPQ